LYTNAIFKEETLGEYGFWKGWWVAMVFTLEEKLVWVKKKGKITNLDHFET